MRAPADIERARSRRNLVTGLVLGVLAVAFGIGFYIKMGVLG